MWFTKCHPRHNIAAEFFFDGGRYGLQVQAEGQGEGQVMGGIFGGGPSMPAPVAPPPPPSKSDAEVRGEALLDRQRRAAAKGRQSTILTGATGGEDTGASQKKALLGE